MNERIRSRYASSARRPQLVAMTPQSQTEIDARLNYIPSVDHQNRRMTVARDDSGEALENQFQKPWRLRAHLREAVEIEMIAIHRRVDQRRRIEHRRKLARDRRGMEIVHLGIEQRPGRLTSAATMRGDEKNRSVTFDDFQPRRGGGVGRFINLTHEA